MATLKVPQARPRASAAFDWGMIVLSSVEATGGFIDGWAHNHFHHLETFFTPWHAMVYGGFMLVVLYLVGAAIYWHRRGYPWSYALPAGYGLSLLGIAVFVVGGALDMTWHLIFGIERSVSALVSPTHLILIVGDTLIGLGPLRSVLARDPERKSWVNNGPFIVSLTWFLSSCTFFTQYASPFGATIAAASWRPAGNLTNLYEALGIASIVLQSAILMGALLFAVAQQRVPFAGFTFMLADNTLLMVLMRMDSLAVPLLPLIGVALLTGVVADILFAVLHPSSQRLVPLRIFSFAIPALLYALYMGVVGVWGGTYWPAHLFVGAPALAGLIGFLISFLIERPATQDSHP